MLEYKSITRIQMRRLAKMNKTKWYEQDPSSRLIIPKTHASTGTELLLIVLEVFTVQDKRAL